MASRKSFLLRLPPELMDELNRWAKDDLRSVNAQIEFLLKEALARAGRVREAAQDGELARDEEAPGDA